MSIAARPVQDDCQRDCFVSTGFRYIEQRLPLSSEREMMKAPGADTGL